MFIDDVPGFDPYKTIFLGPKPKHQLPMFVSKVETHFKAFYKMFAHYANTGMNAALADTLTLDGIVNHNVDICHWFVYPMESLLLHTKTLCPCIMTPMQSSTTIFFYNI
jgi:hypothetical protein